MTKKILLVDDALINISFLEMLFLKHDTEVFKAMNAAEVETLIETQSFDIALVDYHMPDVNGVMLIQRLVQKQQIQRLGDLYIQTADIDFSPDKAGIAKYIKGCFRKPVNVDELEEKLFPGEAIDEEITRE